MWPKIYTFENFGKYKFQQEFFWISCEKSGENFFYTFTLMFLCRNFMPLG